MFEKKALPRFPTDAEDEAEAQLVAKESPEGNNINTIIGISIIIRFSFSNCIFFRVLYCIVLG